MKPLVIRTPQAFWEKQRILARTLHRVTELDLRQRQVQVENMETGKIWREPFDQLLVATGAIPIRPNVTGVDASGIYALNTLQSGIEARQAADRKRPDKIVIVGAGYIGVEMAESFVLRGLDVSIVEKAGQVMNTMDADMAELVAGALRESGVKLYLEESLEGFEVSRGEVREVATTNRSLPADLVILALGVLPNSTLAAKAGIPTGEMGGIRVDETMQTPLPGIWAAGNCVETWNRVSRRPFYAALGTVANKQGRVAGINIAGGKAAFPGALGTSVNKFCALEMARTGLTEKEVQGLGWSYISARIESHTRAHYYPGARPITVKVLAEKGSGRLLGGQIVGGEGAAKRIDTLAVALQGGFTIEEMINLDLGYAPPFSPVWDPVLIAVRKAAALV